MISEKLRVATHAAVAAGCAIMEIYDDPNSDFSIERKEDNSPLTIADKRSHEVICSYLEPLGVPILSEEGAQTEYEERAKWEQLWVVDPLDGTKEFIKKNGEFTVNIALVERGEPIMGVIYIPATGALYIAEVGVGTLRARDIYKVSQIEGVEFESEGSPFDMLQKPERQGEPLRIVASRSHQSPETKDYVDTLCAEGHEMEFVSVGSSIKIALVAAAEADIYPRFAPTMEWDTAAGDALLRAQGRSLIDANTGRKLSYNKPNLLNPFFIAK